MKKKLILAVIILCIGTTTINAQNNGFQRQTVQERVSNTMSKLTALKLDSATTVQADSIFTTFYTAQQKAMQDMMSGGGQPDRDAMKQKRQELSADRDVKLKAIFTTDQYNNWINNIEPSLRPQRGNRQNTQ